MERSVRQIVLPGGETVLAAVRVLDEDRLPPAYEDDDFEDTGPVDRLLARVEQLGEVITGVGTAVLEAARAAAPDEVSATFGVDLVVKPGRAVAMLADGEAKGSLSVTLTWRPSGPR